MSADDNPECLVRAIAAIDQEILRLKQGIRDLARKPLTGDTAACQDGDPLGEISRLADRKSALRERLTSARARPAAGGS